MNIIDDAKMIISDPSFREGTLDLLADSLDALSGLPIPVARIMFSATRSLLTLKDQIFWLKYEKFLSGVFTSDDEKAKFAKELASNGDKNENAIRLLSCIEKTDTQRKIQYLINASRCLTAGFIALEEYFRICHVVTQCVAEDLQFLADHISEKDFDYSVFVQGLLSAGLMRQTNYDFGNSGEQRYGFTPLAYTVDQYSVSYDNIVRYPNPTKVAPPEIPALSSNVTEFQQSFTKELAAVKKDVSSNPRIFTSFEEPAEMRNGDIWFRPE